VTPLHPRWLCHCKKPVSRENLKGKNLKWDEKDTDKKLIEGCKGISDTKIREQLQQVVELACACYTAKIYQRPKAKEVKEYIRR